MGSGRAKLDIDIPLFSAVIAIVLCSVAVALNTGTGRFEATSHGVFYGAGSFVIVLLIFLGWSLIQDEVNKTYSACMMAGGAIWNIGAGINLIVFYIDNEQLTGKSQLIGGCLGLAGGIVMLVEALHNFGIF